MRLNSCGTLLARIFSVQIILDVRAPLEERLSLVDAIHWILSNWAYLNYFGNEIANKTPFNQPPRNASDEFASQTTSTCSPIHQFSQF